MTRLDAAEIEGIPTRGFATRLPPLRTRQSWIWLLCHIFGAILVLLAYADMLRFQLRYDTIVWLGWGVGLAGLPVLFLLHYLRSYVAPVPAQAASWRPGWLSRIGAVALPAVAVSVLKHIDLSWKHIDTSGALLVAYSASRFVLALTLIVLCFTLGSTLLRRLVPDLRLSTNEPGRWFVLSFFAGASIYALVATAVGLVGFLHLVPILLLTLPVLLLAPDALVGPLQAVTYGVRRSCTELQGAHWWARHHLLWCLLWIAGMLLVTRGLYPGSTTNDVWAHYLQYFHEVLRSGSVGPNEVWYHFHLSKAAGLFHLAGVLSDGFAGQLVSWACVIVTAAIVFQLTRRFTGDASWSLFAAVVFLSVYRGSFFKNHDVLGAFIAFLVWGLIEIDGRTEAGRRVFLVAMAGSAFYLGFYQPVGSTFVCAFLGISSVFLALFPALRRRARDAVSILAFLLAGMATVLVLNYQLTGLAEIVPIEFFWSMADKAAFERTFGFSGIAYLLHVGADLKAIRPTFDFAGLADAFRFRQLENVFPLGFVCLSLIALGVLTWRRRATLSAPGAGAVVFLSFAVAAGLTYTLGYSASLLRIFVFTTFFSTITLTMLARVTVRVISTSALHNWVCAGFLIVLGGHTIGQELWYLRAIRSIDVNEIAAYMLGRRSMSDVLHETGERFSTALKYRTVEQLRKALGPDARILDLGLNQSPAYVYPGAGLLSEGAMSFGPDHRHIIFGTPETARSGLQRLRINHFLLNLRSPLFSSVAFSQLFNAHNIDNHLGLVGKAGDNYVLSWRSPETQPLPDRFVSVLELKQKALLHYPSSAEFRTAIRSACDRLLTTSPADTQSLQALAQAVGALMEQAMVVPAVHPSNRALLAELVASYSTVLARHIGTFATRADSQPGSGAGNTAALHDELARIIAGATALYTETFCVRRLDGFGKHLMRDERQPFGALYRDRATFDALIGI